MDDSRFQFRIDVPRITLFIDGEGPIDTTDPPKIWESLVTHFGYCNAARSTYYLTQTCLASHYIEECKFMDQNEFLLSTNLHEVYVSSVNKTVIVKRRFRMTRMIENNMYDLDTCTLTLVYLIEEHRELPPRWDYLVNLYYRGNEDEVAQEMDNEFVLV